MPQLWWGFWKDYPKVTFNGKEYAKIGDRMYTEHAVTRFLPSGRRTVSRPGVASGEGGGYAFDPKARSISPHWVETAIAIGSKVFVSVKNEERTIHTAGDIMVVTTRDNQIVITCGYTHD